MRRLATVLALLVSGWMAVSPPSPPAPVPELDALMIILSGTVAQRRASELLNYHRIEYGVEACMRAAGRDYHRPAYVSFYDDFVDADFGYGNGRGTVLDSLTAGSRHDVQNLLAFRRLQRAGAHERRFAPADADVMNGCTAPYQHRSYTDFDPPPGSEELTALNEVLLALSRDPAIVAATRPYGGCMKSSGYDVGDDPTEYLHNPMVGHLDTPGSPAWNRGVAAMDARFAADARCRAEPHRLAMAALPPLLTAFQSAHRTQINQIQATWRHRVTKANTLP